MKETKYQITLHFGKADFTLTATRISEAYSALVDALREAWNMEEAYILDGIMRSLVAMEKGEKLSTETSKYTITVIG